MVKTRWEDSECQSRTRGHAREYFGTVPRWMVYVTIRLTRTLFLLLTPMTHRSHTYCYDLHDTRTLFLLSLISYLLSLGSLISYLLPPISRISYLLSLISYLSDLLSPTSYLSLITHHSHTHSTMTRLPLLYNYYIYG